MKQFLFVTALCAGAFVFAGEPVPTVEGTAAQCPPSSCGTSSCDRRSTCSDSKMQKKDAHVYVTNNSDDKVTFEWMVMYSQNKRSMGSETAMPGDQKQEADKLNWMVDADEAAMHPVYEFEVRVKENRGGKVLAQKKFQRTLGPKDLVGKCPANLYIVYDGKCKMSAYLD